MNNVSIRVRPGSFSLTLSVSSEQIRLALLEKDEDTLLFTYNKVERMSFICVAFAFLVPLNSEQAGSDLPSQRVALDSFIFWKPHMKC